MATRSVTGDAMVAQIDRTYLKFRVWKLWPRLLAYALFEGRPLTTRGQFVNPFLAVFHRILMNIPAPKSADRPIFVIGTGRSGTTILGIVLSMHRDVGFLNEPKLLWHGVVGGEDLIGSYSKEPGQYRLDQGHASPAKRARFVRLLGWFSALSGASRVVDKYPELIFRTECVDALFPDALYIFLARDGSQTAASIEKWSQSHSVETSDQSHDWWGADDRKWHAIVEQLIPGDPDLAPHQEVLHEVTDHRLRAGVEWVLSMREGLKLKNAISPDRFLHLDYQSLCEDPKAEMARIFDFAGLCHDPVCQEYAKTILHVPKDHGQAEWPEWFQPIFDDTQNQLVQNTDSCTVGQEVAK